VHNILERSLAIVTHRPADGPCVKVSFGGRQRPPLAIFDFLDFSEVHGATKSVPTDGESGLPTGPGPRSIGAHPLRVVDVNVRSDSRGI